MFILSSSWSWLLKRFDFIDIIDDDQFVYCGSIDLEEFEDTK
jgi:hypothetical protein